MPRIPAYEEEIRPEVERRLGASLDLVSPSLFPNFPFFA